ncbi:thioesterase II family protein [Streptomyces avicenniae]|uniref:thioesterase II family protein n=1 Tax=Streptomyces avicenniae TaxID=500153 RepID=UPI00069A3560|nr:alpha/beta fold hydrolase [Streptomyces avicenniae]
MTRPADESAWLRRFHPEGRDNPVRLVCFPHAGGSASFWFPYSRDLAARADVLAVQYPGRQDRLREPALLTIPELADALYPAVLPLADRPLALLGHSMGAVLAFEIARRLEREAGVTPAALFASGRRAPGTHRTETVHLRGDDALLADIRGLSGTDPRILDSDELLRVVLPALRADYRAIETYRYVPGPPLGCPLHVLTGTEDSHVSAAEAEAWRELTTGPFSLRRYPGGHFFLTDHQAALTRTVASLLSGVEGPAQQPC